MLYDPKWEHPTETIVDPLSLAGLIAWLEKQPPATEYEWMNCGGGCLIDQYGASIGFEHLGANRQGLISIFGRDTDDNVGFNYGKVCSSLSGSTTFGAALDRARSLNTAEREGER